MNAKEDAQLFVDELLPFTEKLLNDHGEFFPFGGKIINNGVLVHEGASNGEEQPPSQELIDLLRASHKQEAQNNIVKATCIVYDTLSVPPGKNEKQDCIVFEIDHINNYSVYVIFPYKIANSSADIEAPYAVEGNYEIFGV